LISVPVAAQSHPQTRQGFTIGFGLGGGSAAFSCDFCGDDREAGGVGYLRLGGAVRPNLVVAGEVGGWAKEQDGVTLSATNVTGTLVWYPNVASGFFLKTGLGFGSIDVEIQTNGGTFTTSRSGLGFQVGAGYDWRVARNFSLSPFATYSLTNVELDDVDERLGINVLHIGLGFVWH
jgi:hypothetical protein